MPKAETVFHCSFCQYHTRPDVREVEKHESTCMLNPAAKGCKTCENFIPPVGWTDKLGRFTGKTERCSQGISLIREFKTECPSWASQ